jgi:protein TonB
MNNARSFLGQALALSLALHAAVIALGMQLIAPKEWALRPAPAELTVLLHDRIAAPDIPVAAPPRLFLPQAPQRNASAVEPTRPGREAPLLSQPGSPQPLSGVAALKAAEQLARDLPYPAEAIERGLQGEALVLLFLDASGNAIAARLEASSGHALLDEAAVRAARQLRALPASAPREALLPVRFRLR